MSSTRTGRIVAALPLRPPISLRISCGSVEGALRNVADRHS